MIATSVVTQSVPTSAGRIPALAGMRLGAEVKNCRSTLLPPRTTTSNSSATSVTRLAKIARKASKPNSALATFRRVVVWALIRTRSDSAPPARR